MALQIIDSNLIGTSITAATVDLTGADDVIVLAGVNVTASACNAISGGGDNHRAIIAGQVAAQFTGIFLGAAPAVNVNSANTIAASGSVTADLMALLCGALMVRS